MSFHRQPFRTSSAKATFSFIWTFFQTAASKNLEKDCFGFPNPRRRANAVHNASRRLFKAPVGM